MITLITCVEYQVFESAAITRAVTSSVSCPFVPRGDVDVCLGPVLDVTVTLVQVQYVTVVVHVGGCFIGIRWKHWRQS